MLPRRLPIQRKPLPSNAETIEAKQKLSRRIQSMCGARPTVFDMDASFTPPLPVVPEGRLPSVLVKFQLNDVPETDSIVLQSWLIYGCAATVQSTLPWSAPFHVLSVAQSVDGSETAFCALVEATTVSDVTGFARSTSVRALAHELPSSWYDVSETVFSGDPIAGILEIRAANTQDLQPQWHWNTAAVDDETNELLISRNLVPSSPALASDTVVSLLPASSLSRSAAIQSLLCYVRTYQMDVAGLRVVHPGSLDPAQLSAFIPQGISAEAILAGPVLALALRSHNAIQAWSIALGPMDPLIAKRTDPSSFRAMLGTTRSDVIIVSERFVSRINNQLAFWFGPRCRPDEDGRWVLPQERGGSTALLTVFSIEHAVIALPSLVTADFMPLVLCAVLESGFATLGIMTTKLAPARRTALRLDDSFTGYVTFVVTARENAGNHAELLRQKVIQRLKVSLAGKVGVVLLSQSDDTERIASECVLLPSSHHVETRLQQLPALAPASNDAIQTVAVFLALDDELHAGTTLVSIATETAGTLRLVALKWMPRLESAQAKEATPFEIGDAHWRSSIESLTSAPIVLAVYRGLNAQSALRDINRRKPVRACDCDSKGVISLTGAACVAQRGRDVPAHQHILP